MHVLLALTTAACLSSPDPERADPWSAPAAGEQADGVADGDGALLAAAGAPMVPRSVQCLDGEERTCLVHHQLANGVPTCWEGIQICSEGRWSPCGELPPAPSELPGPR